MRPVAQAAVVSSHALIFLAPITTSLTAAGLLFVVRFSRDSFFFISALVLTLTYVEYARFPFVHFWRRRLLLTGVPYLCWTVIYFVFINATPVASFPFYHVDVGALVSGSGLVDFLTLLKNGYYQLYFVVVLLEFYVLFPLLLLWLRRARRWHVPVLVVAVLWQFFYDIAIRRHLFPFALSGRLETRLIVSYPIYLLAGMIVALHLGDLHDWVVHHARAVIAGTAVVAVVALSLDHVNGNSLVAQYLAPRLDVFAPLAVIYNLGAIACLYLLGVYLTSAQRRAWIHRVVGSTSRASLGIYLSQLIWIPILIRVSTKIHLSSHLSWFVFVAGVAIATFLAGYVVTLVAERTPLSGALVGQPTVAWRRRRDPTP
jgi:peptidoglycan/LPS O-acetylase OafA/YrhL